MRGESHLTASFMISLPTIMALFNMAPDTMTNVMGYLLGGVLLGCLLPDVDASDAICWLEENRSKPWIKIKKKKVT
ncbi:unnamed protein product [marine sediment metagenome]|uniref:Uncharacterized protein n=1 Tax=marine sediment metagenome TaxID=412755 RepID=X1CPF0_9ZZZZ